MNRSKISLVLLLFISSLASQNTVSTPKVTWHVEFSSEEFDALPSMIKLELNCELNDSEKNQGVSCDNTRLHLYDRTTDLIDEFLYKQVISKNNNSRIIN